MIGFFLLHESLLEVSDPVCPASPVRGGRGPLFHDDSGFVRSDGRRAVRREVRRASARVPRAVSARRRGRGPGDRRDCRGITGTPPPPRRTTVNSCTTVNY